MATVDELQVQISANAANFEKELNSVKKQLSSVSGSSSKLTGGMLAGFSAIGVVIGNVLTKVLAMVAESMDDAVSRLDTLNNFPKVMSNLGIGAEDAQKSIDTLSSKIEGLPTTLDDATMAVQRFTSANSNIGASTQMFLAVNNAILAGGASMEIQSSALEQLSQAYAKGKPDMMEWRTMMTAMPAQLKQVATAMGYADSTALGEALRGGTISMNDFMATVVKLNKEGVAGFQSFEDQAFNATGGVATAMTNLKNAVTRGLTAIMDAIGQSNIAGFLNNVKNAILTAGNYVAAFVKVVLTAINALSALFGGKGAQAKTTANATSAAADSMGAVASNADDATSAIDGTTGSAKKLAKQLAGFDEMNVLKEQDSSSGSSSGGSAGSADLSGIEFDADIFGKSTDKVAELAEEMMAKLKKIFDFDKIGKAIKRFADDVKKFLTPLGKIANDVWNKYLKPFVSWVGNDLFPAFLNAVGGAINFIGTALGKFWDGYLKPFIDYFLVPIAQFTGGVIVSVLNAIGDALRGIASNQTAMDIIVNTLGTIVAIFVAAKAAAAIGALVVGVKAAVASVVTAITTIKAATAAGLTMTSAMGAAATASTGLGAAAAGMGMKLSSMASAVFSPLGIAIGVVVAALVVFKAAMESQKLATMEAELAEKLYVTTQESAEQTVTWHNEAIQQQINLKEELEGRTKSLADAQLSAIQAQENLESAQATAEATASKYGMTTDELKQKAVELASKTGALTAEEKELAKAGSELISKEEALKEATAKVGEIQQANIETSEEYDKQKWKEIMTSEKARIEAMLAEGKYDDVRKAIGELATSTQTYTDINGKECQMTKEDVESMADFIGDQLAQIDDDNGQAWQSIWDDANRTSTKLKNETANKLATGGRESGENFTSGIQTGMNNKKGGLFSSLSSMANGLLNNFKSIFQIHSPSRVMAKMGGYIMEGLEDGIDDGATDTLKSVSSVSKDIIDQFSGMAGEVSSITAGTINTDMAGFSNAVARMNSNFESDLQNSIETSNQTSVVVKIGEDTLIDKIVDGVNAKSFLDGRIAFNL